MKAVVYTRYGGPEVLRLTDADTPVPGDGQVLVQVRAVSLNASDWEVLRGKPLYSRIGGPFRPRHHVLGSDIARRVAAAGRKVTRFRQGRRHRRVASGVSAPGPSAGPTAPRNTRPPLVACQWGTRSGCRGGCQRPGAGGAGAPATTTARAAQRAL